MPASEMAKAAPVLASAKAVPHRTLLSQQLVATSKARLAAMKGSMLDEEGGDEAAADTAAEAPAAEAPAAEEPAAEETGSGDNATDTSANGSPSDSSDSEGSLEMAKATFLGAHGWVVTWLTVEGFTALGLPLVSIAMLLMRMHENACVSCILYLVAVFQALWLIGTAWGRDEGWHEREERRARYRASASRVVSSSVCEHAVYVVRVRKHWKQMRKRRDWKSG